MKIIMDNDGRVAIPKKDRAKLGKQMYVIDTPDGGLLVPFSVDPVAGLERIDEKIPAMTINELREEIKKQAIEELRKM